jgi:hypothetical protein
VHILFVKWEFPTNDFRGDCHRSLTAFLPHGVE